MMAPRDMYGNVITRLGETGFGVSTTWYQKGGFDTSAPRYPYFCFFHASDGFRQMLFAVQLGRFQWGPIPGIGFSNVFGGRVEEVLAHLDRGAWPLPPPPEEQDGP